MRPCNARTSQFRAIGIRRAHDDRVRTHQSGKAQNLRTRISLPDGDRRVRGQDRLRPEPHPTACMSVGSFESARHQ
jgi:hypothetical protein